VQLARLALLLLPAACGPAGARDEEPTSRALYELERLSFVPPAPAFLMKPWTNLSLTRAIVIDRYELTRADLRHHWPQRRARADELVWPGDLVRDTPERADWPAVLDFHEASEIAALRGMRLPTPLEWLHVAIGSRFYFTPWGGPGREYFANTQVRQEGIDYSLNAPTHVGTYENGRSRPYGCYDLLGNVWEWVDGTVPGYVDYAFEDHLRGLPHEHGGTFASVMGGAYDSAWRRTYEGQRFFARAEDKRTLSPAIGARMCAHADAYLWEMASRWGTGEAARARVRAVGRDWGRDELARAHLRSLLEDLRARPDAPHALAWLEEGFQAAGS
jgi:hypothetical protein